MAPSLVNGSLRVRSQPDISHGVSQPMSWHLQKQMFNWNSHGNRMWWDLQEARCGASSGSAPEEHTSLSHPPLWDGVLVTGRFRAVWHAVCILIWCRTLVQKFCAHPAELFSEHPPPFLVFWPTPVSQAWRMAAWWKDTLFTSPLSAYCTQLLSKHSTRVISPSQWHERLGIWLFPLVKEDSEACRDKWPPLSSMFLPLLFCRPASGQCALSILGQCTQHCQSKQKTEYRAVHLFTKVASLWLVGMDTHWRDWTVAQQPCQGTLPAVQRVETVNGHKFSIVGINGWLSIQVV